MHTCMIPASYLAFKNVLLAIFYNCYTNLKIHSKMLGKLTNKIVQNYSRNLESDEALGKKRILFDT